MCALQMLKAVWGLIHQSYKCTNDSEQDKIEMLMNIALVIPISTIKKV